MRKKNIINSEGSLINFYYYSSILKLVKKDKNNLKLWGKKRGQASTSLLVQFRDKFLKFNND